jgi:hypothetical protein
MTVSSITYAVKSHTCVNDHVCQSDEVLEDEMDTLEPVDECLKRREGLSLPLLC